MLYGSYPDGAALAAPGVADAIFAAVHAHWGLGSRLLSDIFIGGADSAEHERFARFQREAVTAETAAACWISSIASTCARTFPSSAGLASYRLETNRCGAATSWRG